MLALPFHWADINSISRIGQFLLSGQKSDGAPPNPRAEGVSLYPIPGVRKNRQGWAIPTPVFALYPIHRAGKRKVGNPYLLWAGHALGGFDPTYKLKKQAIL
jgi:hypothetical protein